MNQDILLSKIVPNPTDTTWAQAYTTLNVYVTLSIENEQAKTPVTSHGKDLLEKLQREFFALDEKTLDNIKKAVGNVSKSIGDEYTYSIIVGAIVNSVLYIVIASDGQVAVKRGGKSGIIAKGVRNEIHGFSGNLKHDDIIIFQTGDFAKKIPLDTLTEYLSTGDVHQIAEDITPLAHEGAKGTECAIIIQYKDLAAKRTTPDNENLETVEDEDTISEDDDSDQIQSESTDAVEPSEEDYSRKNLWEEAKHENRNIEDLEEDSTAEEESSSSRKFPSLSLPFNFANRKILIVGAIVVLLVILIGGIAFQTSSQNDQKRKAEFASVLSPLQEKFEAGSSLSSLNKTLALEDLNEVLKMVDDVLSRYPEGSDEYKALSALKSSIESKISETGGGSSAKNVKEFLKPGGEIKSITAVSARGGELVILDSLGEQVVSVASDGDVDDTYDIKAKDTYMASDDKFIYTLGSSVTRIDKGNGNVTEVLKEAQGNSIDLFGSNFYILSGKEILKYRAPSEDSTDYFTEEPGISGKPTGMSISGSVWVMDDKGQLYKFTKGKKDDFEVTGLESPFSGGAVVYADPDNTNIYVLDVKNQRVVVLSDSGEFQKQYEGNFINNATSFAISEELKTGYVVSKGIITSFDL